jgi:hypothetical protein
VLYSFRELAGEVRRVLASRRRRLVVSAYVGDGALDYLPRPRNTTLICWPQPSGTNPAAVSALVKAGVKVFFSDNLHIKLYYGEERGAVLTSANLSRNGLGGGLMEIGVLLPPGAVDASRVLSSIPRRKWTRKEHERLWAQWDDYRRRNGRPIGGTPRADSYTTWFVTPGRRPWKLGWWDEPATFSQEDIDFAKSRQLSEPDDFISAGRPNTYKKGDWVLTYLIAKAGRHPRIRTPAWLFIDGVTYDPSETDGYRYHAVQLQKWHDQGLRPPFTLDKGFRHRFAAVAEKDIPGTKRMTYPSHRLLKLLLRRT